MKRRGFTLVEMLCVLAMLSIFVVIIGQSMSNSLKWFQNAFEKQVIEEHFQHALDMIEEDVRRARDIDRHSTDMKNNLTVKRTSFLYLECADREKTEQSAFVVYKTRIPSDAEYKSQPVERPRVEKNLCRSLMDSTHEGNFQPIANYIYRSHGFVVSYFDCEGKACAAGEDVYAVKVTLTGQTKQGIQVTKERLIPLATKP